MKKILCLSTSNYYPYPTRKQNIMNRMTDCEIIYIDPAVTYLAPLKDSAAKAQVYRHKESFVQARENIKVYAQPPILPFYNKYRWINKSNQSDLARYIHMILKENKWDNDFWIWAYSPTACDLIPALAKELKLKAKELWSRTVYDCVDRHSAYPGMINPVVVDRMEEDLAGDSACVFATAEGLYDRLSQFNRNTHLVPNGCNFELFNKTASLEKTETKTVLGFVGVVQECTDMDVLIETAKAFPFATIRFIGKKLPGVDTSALEKLPNVEFRGLVPQEELPEHIKEFDLCLNVFADNELSKDVSPLKFYEYLATGKPVVSTPMPKQVQEYADCIYIAHSPAEFVEKCKEALSEEDDDPKRAARIAAAKRCSWDERVREIRGILGWE
jgi:glycosyltransferase involved in cell wall biosynthesis